LAKEAEDTVNAAIELHDSQVVAVESATGTIIVWLAAYVHRSDGRPGFDPGSGWSQRVALEFGGTEVPAGVRPRTSNPTSLDVSGVDSQARQTDG
jgi:hypothetical protein